MEIKGKYKEKQRALLKIWLQKCSDLATLGKIRRSESRYLGRFGQILQPLLWKMFSLNFYAVHLSFFCDVSYHHTLMQIITCELCIEILLICIICC